MMKQLSTAAIEAGMSNVAESPQDGGTVEMIVARPSTNERKVLEQGKFTVDGGLQGDNWLARGSNSTEDGRAHPDMQITMMNVRFLDLIAGSKERWSLAGDQLVVDLDLSQENLVPGQRLQVGDVIFEVTAVPHNGCKKFSERFGKDAIKFANSTLGRTRRLRGIYVKVIKPGSIRIGDTITKLSGQ